MSGGGAGIVPLQLWGSSGSGFFVLFFGAGFVCAEILLMIGGSRGLWRESLANVARSRFHLL